MCPGEAAEHDRTINRRLAAIEGLARVKTAGISVMEMVACLAVAQGTDNEAALRVVERIVSNNQAVERKESHE